MRRRKGRWVWRVGPLAVLLVIVLVRRKWVGTFLGIPYDFRPPTPRHIVERCWNPGDPRLFTPHVFGWGWSVNLYTLAKRLGLLRR